MRGLSRWAKAGLVTAGVSAALLLGAATANAEAGHGADPNDGSTSVSSDTGPHLDKRLHGIAQRLSSLAANPSRLSRPHNETSLHARPLHTKLSIGRPFNNAARAGNVDKAESAEPAASTGPVGPAEKATNLSAPRERPALKAVGSLLGGVRDIVSQVGSVAVNTLQAVEAVITGPPKVPPNSTVTVKSSTIRLDNGQTVAANWYYPKTTDGAPPPNMILLQHGFFAQGPMYSYTAANLAEETNSIVVTPTLSSNFFADDSSWLGGTGMAESIGALFVGERTELTASAVAAGYAAQYHLDPNTAQLPQKFALEGHSLGANLVSGAAGYIVEHGGGDDLVGVILLDGVPIGDTLPVALAALDDYAAKPGGHYIPVREIGAPFNLFNSISTVNDDLTAARPDRFNGVVLDGGVHMDSMRGGNPLIQLAAYAVAGFPQPQNPGAVDQLSTTWLNEWFINGDTGGDDGLEPGSSFDVPGSSAHGVVIGASRPKVLAAALQSIFPLLLTLL